MCVREISGMKMISGCAASGWNSPEVAPDGIYTLDADTSECARRMAREKGEGEGRTFKAADVARPLDDGHLKAEADPEERDLLLAGPLDREHHALRPAHAKPARDKDPATRTSASHGKVCIDSTDPAETTARHASWYFAGFVVCVSGSRSEESTHWRTLASVWTEILHGSYLQDEPAVTPKCGVLERFGDRHVRVVQIGVLPNEHDRHVVDDPFLPNHGVTIGRPIH